MILQLLAVAAGLAAAQTQGVILATQPVTNATGTVTSTTSPVVGVTTTTVSLTTAPLPGATTGLGAPTNAPGASFTPPGAVPQGFNGVGAPFTQPGTLTPQVPPNTTPPPPPQTTPQQQTTPPQTNPLTPKKQSRAEQESTRAALQLDQENVERHRRLHEQFLARRKLLTESDDWKFSSWSERRAQLKALRREYDEREAWLRDDYLQKREGLLKMAQGG